MGKLGNQAIHEAMNKVGGDVNSVNGEAVLMAYTREIIRTTLQLMNGPDPDFMVASVFSEGQRRVEEHFQLGNFYLTKDTDFKPRTLTGLKFPIQSSQPLKVGDFVFLSSEEEPDRVALFCKVKGINGNHIASLAILNGSGEVVIKNDGTVSRYGKPMNICWAGGVEFLGLHYNDAMHKAQQKMNEAKRDTVSSKS